MINTFRYFGCAVLGLFLLTLQVATQVPVATQIDILKAEDSRDYNNKLAGLLKSPNEDIRSRAALAAGRIGDEAAVSALVEILAKDRSDKVRAMAAFAIGEIESINAAEAILIAIGETAKPLLPNVAEVDVRGRLVEAAGKIAAANPKDPKAKELSESIIFTLQAEHLKGERRNSETVLLALTAALRARPEGANVLAAKFLADKDARIRADAANTLARLRAKNANAALKDVVLFDKDDAVRVNAIRALAAAEDKDSVNLLIETATNDKNVNIRIAGQRALAALGDKKAAEPLLAHANKTLENFKKAKKPNFIPVEQNELLEIATAFGRMFESSDDGSVISFFDGLRKASDLKSPEIETAFAKISPKTYLDRNTEFISNPTSQDWRTFSAMFQGLGVLAGLESTDENKNIVREANFRLLKFAEGWSWMSDKEKRVQGSYKYAIPDLLRAVTNSKGDKSGILGPILDRETDPFIKATAAELLAKQPSSARNIEILTVAFSRSLDADKNDNDAQLAILDALWKLDKKASVGSLLRALYAPDLRIREKAFELLSDEGLRKDNSEVEGELNLAKGNGMDRLHTRPAEIFLLTSISGTKLGQVLNTDADYRRAATRKNGSVKAVFTTQKGTFTIDLLPEDAPLTVDNFIKLANAKYFDGLEVHRVVPNFVMQDGDPLGNGSGGPGWSIRCEVNMVAYERGAVGMALSGKDTGGSQWFVTHLAQPHLDGGYTVFGKVNETDMKVVDKIVRGDKILTVRIVQNNTR